MKRRVPSRQAANAASDVGRTLRSQQTEQKVPDRFPPLCCYAGQQLSPAHPFRHPAIGRQHYAWLFTFFIEFGTWTTTRIRAPGDPFVNTIPSATGGSAHRVGPSEGLGFPALSSRHGLYRHPPKRYSQVN
jgi:hypothetical protein